MKNVIVLGGTGMLGSMMVDYLSKQPDLKLTATIRDRKCIQKLETAYPQVEWKVFDANSSNIEKALNVVNGNEWIINSIGIIKPLIHDNNSVETLRAISINSLLPYAISEKAEKNTSRILQIATDCVYSGEDGNYTETAFHDAHDVYGKTKSLGEVYAPNMYHLRCSIIGPEPKEFKSLMEWFLGQPLNGQVNGFTNHHWNGLTTLHFTKICHAIIKSDLQLGHLQHIVPSDELSKYELLRAFSQIYERQDISIVPIETNPSIDRTLLTLNKEMNENIWEIAGYNKIPSVIEMIKELADYEYKFPVLGKRPHKT